MAEYVSFVGRLPDGEPTTYVVVTAFTADGGIAFQESFDLRTPGVTPTYVEVAPGTYFVTAKGDGVKFPLHYPVVVPEGSGPTPSTSLTVDLPATPSVRPATDLPCRVYGYLDTPSANAMPGSAVPSHGTTYSDGPSMGGVTVNLDVWFRLRETSTGETRNLSGKGRLRVTSDRNGYFEALLRPGCLYSVSLPTVGGVRYLRTPGPGEEADIETLIQAEKTTSLNELA